ncbi:hypothetical protein [Ferrimonas sp. YFM]|uniref:hypothetical protein n=1 Tax=Ferrimonas sp. YFM TaxID=3028878 RepID=UPI002572D774|nr:hypothetical protein [Ferrimonas sp. YFM]BDY04932.1 hypothetical protein F0521_19730 [Ferrimonas sp. YFM]
MTLRQDPFSGLTTLVQSKGVASLAIADLGGGSAAWVSQALAQRLQSLGDATLMLELAEQSHASWSLDDISAHTAISNQGGLAYLGAPEQHRPLQLNSLVQALLRWQQEFCTVVVHAGSALEERGILAISGCQGVLLVVDGGRDDEEKLERLKVRLKHQGVMLMGVVHNRSALPTLGRELAASLTRRLGWLSRHNWFERLQGWLQQNRFLNGHWS